MTGLCVQVLVAAKQTLCKPVWWVCRLSVSLGSAWIAQMVEHPRSGSTTAGIMVCVGRTTCLL